MYRLVFRDLGDLTLDTPDLQEMASRLDAVCRRRPGLAFMKENHKLDAMTPVRDAVRNPLDLVKLKNPGRPSTSSRSTTTSPSAQ